MKSEERSHQNILCAHATNADRIRAMSDEELAEMFYGGGLCSHIQDNDSAFCEARGACTNCVLEWLQQPADHFREVTKMVEEDA